MLIEKDISTTDPIELYKKKRREEQRNELLLAKLYGDALSLEEEIDEYNKRIDEIEEDIGNFEQDIESYTKNNSKPNIEEEDDDDDEDDNFQGQKGYIEITHFTIEEVKPKLDELKNQVDYARYKGEKAKKEVVILKEDIHKSNSNIKEISKIEFEIIKSQNNFNKLLKSYRELLDLKNKVIDNTIQKINNIILGKLKRGIDKAVVISETLNSSVHDGSGLWNVSSIPEISGKKYLDIENAIIVKNIKELSSQRLRIFISKKLKSQDLSQNTIGFIFDKNSSISTAVAYSQEFRKIISENKKKLQAGEIIGNTSIFYERKSNLNLYLAIKKCDVIDIYIDKSTKILHATVIDTYDFNKGEYNPIIILPRILQQNGKTMPYYSIIKIQIPENLWSDF